MSVKQEGGGGAPLDSPVFTGNPQAPTATFGDNDTTIASTAFVQAAIVGGTAGVASFNTRVGAVVPASGDYAVGDVTGAAPLASPTFTGDPKAPTPATGDSDTSIATTAFVKAQNYAGSHNVLSATHSDSAAASVVLGDVIHGNATPAWARLAGNTTTAKQFLTQTGNGSVSAAPAWGAIAESDVTSLVTDLAAKVATTRTVSTTAPITGGGDLSANRTIAISDFTGDSGSGGAKGSVPAPASGDAGAGKFLKADGTWAVPAGGSSAALHVSSTDAGTGANTTATDLWTYTLPANTLSSNSKGLTLEVYWRFAANANNKTVQVFFGSKKIADSTAISAAPNNRKQGIVATIVRDGASSEKFWGEFWDNGSSNFDILPYATATEDTTAGIVIRLNGQNGTASANDILFSAAVVRSF